MVKMTGFLSRRDLLKHFGAGAAWLALPPGLSCGSGRTATSLPERLKEEDTMTVLQNKKPEQGRVAIPPIDLDIPDRLETATFALG